jgi:hypothetical protein
MEEEKKIRRRRFGIRLLLPLQVERARWHVSVGCEGGPRPLCYRGKGAARKTKITHFPHAKRQGNRCERSVSLGAAESGKRIAWAAITAATTSTTPAATTAAAAAANNAAQRSAMPVLVVPPAIRNHVCAPFVLLVLVSARAQSEALPLDVARLRLS